MDLEPAATSGEVLRFTGLPSRSALVAPPFRLAALRWRGAFVILGRLRPPLGVSTACFATGTRFSVSRVREPGTAARASVRLRPDGDRRMPGIRSSCSWRRTSPSSPPGREFTCSVWHAIPGLRKVREVAQRGHECPKRPRNPSQGGGSSNRPATIPGTVMSSSNSSHRSA
jgi:hypothetical protein